MSKLMHVGKWATLNEKGLKKGTSVWFEHPKCSKIIFGKTQPGAFFDPILVRKWAIFRALATLEVEGPTKAQTGVKRGSFRNPISPRSASGYHFFDPFLTQFGPKMANCQGILGLSIGQNG